MVKTISKKNRIQRLESANDNTVIKLQQLNCEAAITITELEVIETYMQDIIGEIIADNDNNQKG